MTQRQHVRLAIAGLACVLLASAARAEDQYDQEHPLYAPEEQLQPAYPDAQPAYQPIQDTPGIIGYRPISNEALAGVVAAQPQASPVYQAAPGPGQGSSQGGGIPTQYNLPPAYLTGILGDGPYTLGRDDVIRIAVRNQPEFSGEFRIGFDGRIQYNYLGDLPIAGLTKYELQQVMEKLLAEYVRVPVVNVQILAYNSKVVYIIGEVGRPGKFVMRGDVIKLREAILAAGLPTRHAALARIHVIKPDLTNPNIRKINVKPILYKGKLEKDVDLYPGEIVVVPSTVLSAVNRFLGDLLSPINRSFAFASLAAL